jgi:hypothetical protein
MAGLKGIEDYLARAPALARIRRLRFGSKSRRRSKSKIRSSSKDETVIADHLA